MSLKKIIAELEKVAAKPNIYNISEELSESYWKVAKLAASMDNLKHLQGSSEVQASFSKAKVAVHKAEQELESAKKRIATFIEYGKE